MSYLQREQFAWNVEVQGENGQVSTRIVRAYWSPEHELTKESVGWAGAGAALRETKVKHAPISVTLIKTPSTA